VADMTITVGRNGTWYINTVAYRALGEPTYIFAMYDAETKIGVLRGVRDGEPEMYGYSVCRAPSSTAGYFSSRPLARLVAPAGEKRVFLTEHADGTLYFGGKHE
jgi:hypothetical protein